MEVERHLSSGDVKSKVRSINGEIQICDQNIRKFEAELRQRIAEAGGYQKELETADTRRRELTLLDDKNKQIEIYKAYAERIYQELNDVYTKSEAEIRECLETTINDIFKQIYEGGLSLTIDENYHISVYADDYDGDVETSTAQSISVIFAFITGIIKMARDNRNATDADAQLLSSEPYPLVMDAPLSAFDKRRIRTIWKSVIPSESLEKLMDTPEMDEERIEPLFFVSHNDLEEEIIEKIDSNARKDSFNNVINSLTPKESTVLRLRYGIDDGIERTLEEVGQMLNVTRERIRQIENKAFRKIVHPSRQLLLNGLYSYSDIGEKGKGKYNNVKRIPKRGEKSRLTGNNITRLDEMSTHEYDQLLWHSPNNAEVKNHAYGGIKESLKQFVDAKYLSVDDTALIRQKSISKDSFWKWISGSRGIGIDKGQIYRAFSMADQFICKGKKIKHGLFGISKVSEMLGNLCFLLYDDRYFEKHAAELTVVRNNMTIYLDFVINNIQKDGLIREVFDQSLKKDKIIRKKCSCTIRTNIDKDLLEYISFRGLEYFDDRENGGYLWIYGGLNIVEKIKKIEDVFDVHFRFKRNGPDGIKRDAWWSLCRRE